MLLHVRKGCNVTDWRIPGHPYMRCKERAAWLTRHVCTGSTMRFKDDQALPVDLRGGERSEENKSDVRGPRQPWKVSATPPPHPIGQSSGDFFLFHSGWVYLSHPFVPRC